MLLYKIEISNLKKYYLILLMASEKKDKYNLRNKKEAEKQKKRKHSDDKSSSEDDSDFITDEEDEFQLDKKEYTKFLSKLSFSLTTSFLMSINSAKVPQIILAKRNPTAPPQTNPIKLPEASAETIAEVRITRIAKTKFKPASESAKYLFIFFASFSAFCSDTFIINLLYF